MANAIAHWVTPSGQRRTNTDPDKTVRLSVVAACDENPAGENGIQKVEFYVVVNGGAPTTIIVSALTRAAQNYVCTTYRGRHVVTAFHHALDLSLLAAGKVDVTAKVFSNSGTQTTLARTITLRNDTDGTDRRQSTKQIYVSSVSGTSGGAGTIGDPVATLEQAIRLVVANPGGSASADRECGGGEILLLDATAGFGSNYGDPSFHTPNGWTLKIRAIGADKRVMRTSPGVFTDPPDYIIGGGYGGGSDCNVDFHDCEFVGAGPTFYAGGTTNFRIQEFSCRAHSGASTVDPTVSHIDYAANSGQPTNFTIVGSGKTERYSWSGIFEGMVQGPTGYLSVFDFLVKRTIGVAMQAVTDQQLDFVLACGKVEKLRYHPGDVLGVEDTSFQFTNTAGNGNVTITVPVAGQMRIDALNSTPTDFGTRLAPLVGGAGFWGVLISGATSGANNGCFPVLAAGTNGSGFPYVILSNPSAVVEVGGTNLRILTARLSNSDPYYNIHPDILQIFGNCVGFLVWEVRAEDCWDTRSWVGSGRTLVDGAFFDITDGSHPTKTCEFDFASSTLTNVLYQGLSIRGPASFSGTFSGLNFIDCVFQQGNNIPTGAGIYTRNTHFISGPTSGTNPTSGLWFNAEPGLTPWDFSPDSGHIGTASGLLGRPASGWYVGAVAESRGASRHVATDDWSLTSTPSGAIADTNFSPNWSDLNIGCGLVL